MGGDFPLLFQEFQQFIIDPFEAVLLREKTKDSDESDNLAAGLQNYAGRQVFLEGQASCSWLAVLNCAHALLDRAAEHAGTTQDGLQGACFDAPRPG